MKAIMRLTTATGATIDTEWPNSNLHLEGDGRFFVMTRYQPRSVAIDRIMWIPADRVFQAWLVPDDPEPAQAG